MNYEVWSVITDELVGHQEVGNPIEHTVGIRVAVKTKGVIKHPEFGAFNAIEMVVCRMSGKDKVKYYALETNWPTQLLKELEGFTPHVRIPSLTEIFTYGRKFPYDPR